MCLCKTPHVARFRYLHNLTSVFNSAKTFPRRRVTDVKGPKGRGCQLLQPLGAVHGSDFLRTCTGFTCIFDDVLSMLACVLSCFFTKAFTQVPSSSTTQPAGWTTCTVRPLVFGGDHIACLHRPHCDIPQVLHTADEGHGTV